MAYVKPWSTKEEVLKDLAKASGRRRKNRDDLDEGYLVIGDAPPPLIPENEDAEMQLLFGDAASRRPIATEENATPDLAGIQQMIRMMEDYNSGNDEHINDNAANDRDYVIAISKVSRLNPNVQEFKPKGFISPSRELVNKDINSNVVKQTVEVTAEISMEPEVEVKERGDNNDTPEQIVEVTEDIKNEPKVSLVKGEGSGDKNDLEVELNVDKNEYVDIATALKNKISDAAKSDSFEFKKQKNVAIATLLRLYAKNSPSPPKCTTPVKLITPEYFEGKVESRPEVRVQTPLNIASTESSSTPEPRESSTTLPSCSTLSTSTSSTNLTSPKIKQDPEIKKSIDKVNRWLEEPTKPKSPAVCLGPIAFKRKAPVSSKSPVSDTSAQSRKPAVQGQQYQPSKYAADLGQKYLQRNKMLESKQKEVTWTNLEEVLKAKDLEIKRRQEEQASTSSS